ncbi:MAG: SHOCT domain-containing protein [Halobaculum sp.]
MTRRPSRGYHDRVETYTPDGTLGRLLFGLLVGSPSVYVGAFGLATLFGSTGLTGGMVGAVFGLSFSLSGLAGVLVAVTVLWPVYLSLIGNVEHPTAYGAGETVSADDEEDPVAVLKRRYAAGEISREEFERRLDAVVGGATESDRPGSADSDGSVSSGESRERVDNR